MRQRFPELNPKEAYIQPAEQMQSTAPTCPQGNKPKAELGCYTPALMIHFHDASPVVGIISQ